jgi:hypothetical protein
MSFDDNDAALPSSTMTGAKLFPRGETKYVSAIADSIRTQKTFAMIPVGKSKTAKEAVYGIINKIEFAGTELSADEWEAWATNPETNKKEVLRTEFYINGVSYTPDKMWKTEAATGAMNMNKGDAAEAILGASVAAKFLADERNITKHDVLSVLRQTLDTGEFAGRVNGVGDEVEFTLSLNAISMKSIKLWLSEDDPFGSSGQFAIVKEGVPAKTITDLQLTIDHAVEYVNTSNRIMRYNAAGEAVPVRNVVEVISDGGDATQQTTTKVDLKVKDAGVATSLVSLKTGSVKQFGQVSGAEWSAASNFFESVLDVKLPDAMKDEFGFKDSHELDYKDFNYYEGPFASAYSTVVELVGEYPQEQLTQSIYNGINYHATRSEQDVTMLILSPTMRIPYKELAFDERLHKSFADYHIEVINDEDLMNHRLSLIGTRKSDGELGVLLQLRTANSAGTIRNYVEMGPLLKELACIKRLNNSTEHISEHHVD